MATNMDPDYSSRERKGKPGVLSRLLAWHIQHRPGTTGQRQAESHQQLQAMGYERMSSGLRIRNQRLALGWTQSMAAIELAISVRTLIRHEQGLSRRPQSLLLHRLCKLESDCAGEIVAYLTRAERGHPWLPSQQTVEPIKVN